MHFCSLLAVSALLIFLPDLGPVQGGPVMRCPARTLKGGRVRLRSKGRVAKYVCLRGYQVLGDKYSTCVRGKWDSPVPICISNGCLPVDVPHGQVLETYRGALVTVHCDPGYALIGSKSLYCNGAKWNGTAPSCREMNVSAQKWCDFESEDLCGWTQDTSHDFDWTRHSFATPSGHVGTGPSCDHTLGPGLNGHYMYLESSSPRLENDTARLFSPVFPAITDPSACFLFWYHMYGHTTGTLNVYLHSKESVQLFSMSGDQGNVWRQALLPLPPLNYSFQIVVEGVRGSGYEGDMAIDDVKLTTGEECVNSGSTETTDAEVGSSDWSCVGRCLVAAQSVSWCECSPDCLPSNTCCPDFLQECNTTSQASSVQPSEDVPGSEDASFSSTSSVFESTQTPYKNLTKSSNSTTTKMTANSTIAVSPSVGTTTSHRSQPFGNISVNITAKLTPTSAVTITTAATTIKPIKPSTLNTTALKTFTAMKANKVTITEATNTTTTPKTVTTAKPPTSQKPTLKTTALIATRATTAATRLPLYTNVTRSVTVATNFTSKPTTLLWRKKVVFLPTRRPWPQGTSGEQEKPKLQFVTPPPPVIFRTPAPITRTTSQATRLSPRYPMVRPQMNSTTVPPPTTVRSKSLKNFTVERPKSKNDVLHEFWSKGSRMPPLGPPPNTPASPPHPPPPDTRRGAASVQAEENKLKSRYRSGVDKPEHAPVQAERSSLPGTALFCGSLLLLCAVVATVRVVRRRRINRRSSEDDELDIRFLASDEILDFTLARPGPDEGKTCETPR